MSHKVKCVMLGPDAEGLDRPPYPGELGVRIYENVSKEAWQRWLGHHSGAETGSPGRRYVFESDRAGRLPKP